VFIHFLTPFRVDVLAAGALLALSSENRRTFEKWRALSVGLMSLGFVATAMTYLVPTIRVHTSLFNAVHFSAIGAIATGAVAGSVALREGEWIHSFLTWPPLRGLGIISYTAYLVHYPMILLMSGTHPAWLFTIGGTIGVSIASWFLYEQPMIALGRSYSSLPRAHSDRAIKARRSRASA
jgi:peptidoglycan/LPS O-acetylase OafA/YrhL